MASLLVGQARAWSIAALYLQHTNHQSAAVCAMLLLVEHDLTLNCHLVHQALRLSLGTEATIMMPTSKDVFVCAFYRCEEQKFAANDEVSWLLAKQAKAEHCHNLLSGLLHRCEEQKLAAKDEVSRLLAKQAMADKAASAGASQVADLKDALQQQASKLSASEAARAALKVTSELRSLTFYGPQCAAAAVSQIPLCFCVTSLKAFSFDSLLGLLRI